MLRNIARSLLGRFIGIGTVTGGFWLLFKGVFDSNIPVVAAGCFVIPLGMWIMAVAHKGETTD